MSREGDGPGGTRAAFAEDLTRLGLPPGSLTLVQGSYSRVRQGRADGAGPEALVDALCEALGPDGTLVAYTATPENSRTSPHYVRATAGMDEDRRAAYEAALPPYDPAVTPASTGVGVLSELIRRRDGSRRSRHPQTSFAALGRDADLVIAEHPYEEHLGLRTPLGCLYERDGLGVLIGVPWARFTPFHLADYLFPRLPRKTYHAKVVAPGAPEGRWVSFQDLDLRDDWFAELGLRVERELGPRIRRGRVGGADTLVIPIRAAVDSAVRLLRSGEVGE